ncbi:MAG: hypothetical protein DSZ08_02700 [Sulfurovum sp.]|nr:MAG: hypothetical protein DSZ08_02700 [Sulfurovum sp.]
MNANIAYAYTANTLHDAYNKKRHTLLPLLKETKEKEDLKKIHLALLSIDMCIQLFNDANRNFPLINQEILREEQQSIALTKEKKSSLKYLEEALQALNDTKNIIFEKQMHYSIALLENSSSTQIPAVVASNILKESAFLFTHVLHTLYHGDNAVEVSKTMTAFIQYLLGLQLLEPISFGENIYEEILKEREKHFSSDETKSDLENFIFDAHHFSLLTLLFVKHWMGFKEYALEDAEKDLNEKINTILNQRKSNPN